MSVTSVHSAGFFSCCSVKLGNIIDYINLNLQMPDYVNSSQQFSWYKLDQTKDITYDYFEHYHNMPNIISINYIYYSYNGVSEFQFADYSILDYKNIVPFIVKYFSPSIQIANIIDYITKKYNLVYDNICVLFYRGNDKHTETALCNYEEYLIYANLIIKSNPNIIFLIQSDETNFIKFMSEQFPTNSFYFKDEIRHMNNKNSTVDKEITNGIDIFSKNYLAITIIMSRCKYIVCGSGNCSIWIMFYRGNNNNVCQNLNGKWYNTTCYINN